MRPELAGHVLAVAVTKFGGLALSLLLLIVSARLLEPTVFGVFSFFVALTSVASSFVSGGFTQYWTRELVASDFSVGQSSNDVTPDLFNAFHGTLIWVVITGAMVSLLSVLMWPLIGEGAFYGPLFLFAAVLSAAPVSIVSGVARARGRVALGELPGVGLLPLSCLLLLLAISLTDFQISTDLALASYVGGLLIAGSISLFMLRAFTNSGPHRSVPSTFDLTLWIRRFLPFCLLSVVGVLLTQLATVLVGVIEGPDVVASYRIADRMSALVSIPLIILNVVISGSIAKSIYMRDVNQARYLVSRARLIALAFSCVIAFSLIVFGNFLLDVAFGDVYAEVSYDQMLILIAANLINVSFGSVGVVLVMAGLEREVLTQQAISIVLLVVVLVPLTIIFGSIGSAVAVVISTFYWNFRLFLKLRAFFGQLDCEM
jgi:O-antigen/teichoic acid export membrane protein